MPSSTIASSSGSARQWTSVATSRGTSAIVWKFGTTHTSHIRIDAKRQALDALDNLRRGDDANGNGKPVIDAEIATVVEVADDLTSQSRHSLLLQGSPPSGKLLIPLKRRDVRVVEGARLENDMGEQRQATPRHSIAQSLSELTTQPDHAVCVAKLRYGSRF